MRTKDATQYAVELSISRTSLSLSRNAARYEELFRVALSLVSNGNVRKPGIFRFLKLSRARDKKELRRSFPGDQDRVNILWVALGVLFNRGSISQKSGEGGN